MVDHRTGQLTGRLGAQVDQAAVGLDGTALFDQGVQRGFFHLQLDRPTQVQHHLGTCPHQHLARRGGDAAGVADLGRNQRHRAARRGRDVALVDDGTAAGTLRTEAVAARQKVLVVELQGAGHQGPHIDLCARREQHPIGVEQEDLAIGIQGALDARHLIAKHPIQGHRVARGLNEVDGMARPNTEAAPVRGQQGALLLDRQHRAGAADLRLPRHHLCTAGQLSRAQRLAAHQAGRKTGTQAQHQVAQANRRGRLETARWSC